MTLYETIMKRKSVRQFKDKPIPPDLLNYLINLAKRGPSAGAIRGYEVIVTQEKVIGYEAPVYVVVCIDPEKYAPRYGDRGRELYAIQDAAIFAAYLGLLLVDWDIASCWVGSFREGRIKRTLGLREGLRPVAILPVGYEL